MFIHRPQLNVGLGMLDMDLLNVLTQFFFKASCSRGLLFT
jgi:hypothetical protein